MKTTLRKYASKVFKKEIEAIKPEPVEEEIMDLVDLMKQPLVVEQNHREPETQQEAQMMALGEEF